MAAVRAHGGGARVSAPHHERAGEMVARVLDIVLPLDRSLRVRVHLSREQREPADLIGFVIIGGAMSAYWMNVLWSMGEPASLGERDGATSRSTSWLRIR